MPAANRIVALQAAMAQEGLAGACITSFENVRYLTGYYTRAFNPSTVVVIPSIGAPALVVLRQDGSLAQATSAVRVVSHELLPTGFRETAAVCRRLLDEASCSTGVLGLEFGSLTVDRFRIAEETLPQHTFQDIGPLLSEQRMIKDPEEQLALRCAGHLATLGMEHAVDALRPGVREAEVESILSQAVDTEGARRWPQAIVLTAANVLSGPKVGRLHDSATGRAMREGEPVFILASVSWDGYCGGDIGRSVFLRGQGHSVEARVALDAATDAQRAAIQRLAPGVPLRYAGEAAEGVLARHGLAAKRLYRMFRGLGLTNSERPTALELDIALKTGMCVCVQIYVQLDGCIVGRTDSVLITETGADVLTEARAPGGP